MNRLAIFAHFDARGEIKDYVLHHLRALRRVCKSVWFVSTATLSEAELAKASAVSDRAWTRENTGYDFAMWRDALERTDPATWDEIVITNSSVFGPIWPLEEAFRKMASSSSCDFWGMTENIELAWHLQSYFIVFRARVLRSPAFLRFWKSVEPLRGKADVIQKYESRLSGYLCDEGFHGAAYVPRSTLPFRPLKYIVKRLPLHNPTILQPMALLKRRMPYVKVELLRDNPARRALGPVFRAMTQAGYDRSLVEF